MPLSLAVLAALICGDVRAQESLDSAPESALESYSPYVIGDLPDEVFFGDTHNHTINSPDAFMSGTRMTPEQAYRFARGEQVTSSSGVPMKLSRPMDFLVVADHAEGLGIAAEIYSGNKTFMENDQIRRWHDAMQEGGAAAAKAKEELIGAHSSGTLPEQMTDPATIVPIFRSVWQNYLETADEFYQPGTFTSLIGYEWTSTPGGNNLHRNIVFRGDKDDAGQILPFSSNQSANPENLWDWLASYEEKTGDRVLAIPHNANLSNGRMFESQDFAGQPLSTHYARQRARFERLQEVIQYKGNSETHPTLSPNDEFASYGVAGWDLANLSMQGKSESPGMRPTMYLRSGLLRGLEWQESIGENPFKFGFVGGSDTHTGLAALEEDNYGAKFANYEPAPERAEKMIQASLVTKSTRYVWHSLAAGYTAIWARENTREELWNALNRRETYATSGTRMKIRFFGGWQFESADAQMRNLARTGYSKGVPMGSDLPSRATEDGAPTFLIAAMKDPIFGNLDRIQVVKGWVDDSGKGRERIYDVVWGDSDRRQIGDDGKLAPVGNTVDTENATWTNTIGDPELATVWTDPDFDPEQRAFYYARVIEIPTPRWTAYDAARFGSTLEDDIPLEHQEMGWTSPVWYNPKQ